MHKMFSGLMICTALTAVALAADPIPPTGHPESTEGWTALFTGDLSDATFPEGIWSVDEDGVLTATKDKCIWSKKQFDNFILDLEFKNSEGTNSGVIIYATETEGRKWIPNSVEIQIADDYAKKWSESPRSWQCAAVFGRLPAKKSVVKKPGKWNHMTIIGKGQMIYVVLNGELVTEMDMSKWTAEMKNPDGSEIPKWLGGPLSEAATKGHIGLQGKHGGVPIYFRNIKVKDLD